MSGSDLKRRLGLFPATNIVIANIIGAGIFTTSGLLMADLGSPLLMLLLWLIGGLIAICGALSYGELGATIPEAGGEYIFLSKIFSPLYGFLSGWVSFIVGFTAAIAASALGFSEYFLRAFPGLIIWLSDTFSLGPQGSSKTLAIGIIIIFSIIHSRGIEIGAKVQNLLTVLKVILIVALILAALSAGKGDISNFRSGQMDLNGFSGWKTLGLSLMWIMFAYSGWNASTYIGSEIRNPSRSLPASLLIGTGIVIVLYLSLNMIYIYSIPPDEIKGVISVGGLAVKNMFGQGAGSLFSILIAFALFSSLSAYIIIGPRVYFSMARDGLFFKSIAKVHPRFGVPVYSIYLQSVIAILFILTGTFDQILTYLGFSLGIFPVLTVIGLFKLRRQNRVKIKTPLYPLPQIIFILSGIAILVLAFMERPLESSISLITVVAGIPAYFYFRSRRKRKI